MSAIKYAVAGLFGLSATGALAFAVAGSGTPRAGVTRTPPPLALRAFPAQAGGGAVTAPAAPKPAAEAPAAPVAAAEPKPAPAPEPKPVAAAEPKPTPAAEPKPPPAEPKPAAVAAAPKPPPAEGQLNLRASDTADVFVDGKKAGTSPVLGFKVKAGTHKVRFDCYDAAGNTVAGPVRTVSVAPDTEADVEFTCPAE